MAVNDGICPHKRGGDLDVDLQKDGENKSV